MDVAVQLLQIFMGGPFLIYVVLSLFCSDAPTAIIFWLPRVWCQQAQISVLLPLCFPWVCLIWWQYGFYQLQLCSAVLSSEGFGPLRSVLGRHRKNFMPY